MINYDRQPSYVIVQAAEPQEDLDLDVGEIQVAEYVVYLLALDTYMRYIEENLGPEQQDELTAKGLRLLRSADNIHLSTVGTFMMENLPTQAQKNMLTKALALRPNAAGAGKRALLIRTLLSRGGAGTMRAVFKLNKTLQAIRLAISASMVEDADAALDKLAIIPISNVKIRDWIDEAAKLAGPGYSPTPTQTATLTTSSDDTKKLLEVRIKAEGTSATSEEANKAMAEQSLLTSKVETEATQEAAKSIAARGEQDAPPTRSEVAGIIQAQVNSALTDPADSRNVPPSLRTLDPEQRTAALTDGRVLVAAGAGSGKTTTLVSRIKYLVEERKVHPSKIFACSFNKSAAGGIKGKVAKTVGDIPANQMKIETMHSAFLGLGREFGNPVEKTALARENLVKEEVVCRTIDKLWPVCYAQGKNLAEAPPAKKMMRYKSRWAGFGIGPAEAKRLASEKGDKEMVQAALYYEWYEGLKGALPGWKAPCTTKDLTAFYAKYRKQNQRIADFDEMLSIPLAILRRDPKAREALQKKYDHVMVDEAQDLNPVQAEIIEIMAEKVDEAKGQSLWVIGDASQSIYAFRGADVEMFSGLNGKEGWKTRLIKTNYRCAPKIVKAANALIAHNESGMMIEQRPAPGKDEDSGSIVVNTVDDNTDAAIQFASLIKQKMTLEDAAPAHFAVLARTNAELHAFETACLVRGIPYARRGATGLISAPESKALLSYVQMVTGDNYAKMMFALPEVLKKPNRFFVGHDLIDNALPQAVAQYARKIGQDSKSLNPLNLLTNSYFCDILAEKLKPGASPWQLNKTVEQLVDLGQELLRMKANVEDPSYKTLDLFHDILNVKGMEARSKADGSTAYEPMTFADSLRANIRASMSEEDVEEAAVAEGSEGEGETANPLKGLGSISFLFELIRPDPTEPDVDASTPMGFKHKMERIGKRYKDLRTDIDEWNKTQADVPADKKSPPPGVYLSTVHSVKGAEWPNVTVLMPGGGGFPMIRAYDKATEEKRDPTPEEHEQAAKELEAERRLAYVALTRAAENLTVVCPLKNASGRKAGVSEFVGEAGLSGNISPSRSVMAGAEDDGEVVISAEENTPF